MVSVMSMPAGNPFDSLDPRVGMDAVYGSCQGHFFPTRRDQLDISKNNGTEAFSKDLRQHGLEAKPASILSYYQNPEKFSRYISLCPLPSSLEDFKERYQTAPLSKKHESLVKKFIAKNPDLIRRVASQQATENPFSLFDGHKPGTTEPLSPEEWEKAIKNIPGIYSGSISASMKMMAEIDPAAHQKMLDITKNSSMWELKNAKEGTLVGSISHGRIKDLLQIDGPTTKWIAGAFVKGHGYSSVMLQPGVLDKKPGLAKVLVDNAVEQAKEKGDSHVWLSVPDSPQFTRVAENKGNSVTAEYLRKEVSPLIKPEWAQSGMSVVNMMGQKLYHIKL